MIDDIRLSGPLQWRRRGGPLSKEGGPLKWATFPAPTTPFSQRAEPSPLWLETSPKRRIRRGTTRMTRVRCERAQCVRRPPSPGASWRRTGGGGSGESAPGFFGAGAPPGRGKWATLKATIYPPLFGVALTTVIPGGLLCIVK
jgi:hypothetical protein